MSIGKFSARSFAQVTWVSRDFGRVVEGVESVDCSEVIYSSREQLPFFFNLFFFLFMKIFPYRLHDQLWIDLDFVFSSWGFFLGGGGGDFLFDSMVKLYIMKSAYNLVTCYCIHMTLP